MLTYLLVIILNTIIHMVIEFIYEITSAYTREVVMLSLYTACGLNFKTVFSLNEVILNTGILEIREQRVILFMK